MFFIFLGFNNHVAAFHSYYSVIVYTMDNLIHRLNSTYIFVSLSHIDPNNLHIILVMQLFPITKLLNVEVGFPHLVNLDFLPVLSPFSHAYSLAHKTTWVPLFYCEFFVVFLKDFLLGWIDYLLVGMVQFVV